MSSNRTIRTSLPFGGFRFCFCLSFPLSSNADEKEDDDGEFCRSCSSCAATLLLTFRSSCLATCSHVKPLRVHKTCAKLWMLLHISFHFISCYVTTDAVNISTLLRGPEVSDITKRAIPTTQRNFDLTTTTGSLKLYFVCIVEVFCLPNCCD